MRAGNASWKCELEMRAGNSGYAVVFAPRPAHGRAGLALSRRHRVLPQRQAAARAQGWVSLPPGASERLDFSLARRGHKAGFLFRRPRAQSWVSLVLGAGTRQGFSSVGRGRKAGFLSCPARTQGRFSLPPGAGARLGFSLARRGHKAGFRFRRPRAQGWVSLLPGVGTRLGFSPARRRRVHAAAYTTTTRARGGLHDDDACTRRQAGCVGRFFGSTWRQAGCRALSRWHATASGLPGAFSAARGGTRATGPTFSVARGGKRAARRILGGTRRQAGCRALSRRSWRR